MLLAAIRSPAAARSQGPASARILRLGLVYRDRDGHLEAAGLMANGKWHPAQALSLIHHRDIATAVKLAITGALDGHTVNVVDEAPAAI